MGTRYNVGDKVEHKNLGVRFEVVNIRNPDSSSPDYVLEYEDGGNKEVLKASSLKKAEEEETEYKVTIKIGKPVKAGKYYSSSSGRFEKAKYGNPTYEIGRKRNGKIQHSSDIRDVQAYSSDSTFIYSDPQLHYSKLQKIMNKIGVVSEDRYEEVWVMSNGRTKALKLDQFDTVKDLGILADRAEEQGYHVEYYPDIDGKILQIFVKESQLE